MCIFHSNLGHHVYCVVKCIRIQKDDVKWMCYDYDSHLCLLLTGQSLIIFCMYDYGPISPYFLFILKDGYCMILGVCKPCFKRPISVPNKIVRSEDDGRHI
ncbi:hypothetical protein COCON_G00190160 [Conger conger]|uniref:Uncharacterized protein n=1 Tax=Conger conger TaxID=82655 RepID=A0A9Q1HRV9_CONCO|nr:hypothetical protein COCON_G00190160 [Conger conger]